MAVKSIREDFTGRRGNVEESGVVTFQRVLQIETDAWSDGPVQVISGLRYPHVSDPYNLTGSVIKKFDTYPGWPAATLRTTPCEPDGDSPMLWKVTLNYSSGPFEARTSLSSLSSALSASSPNLPSNDPSTGNSNSRPAPSRPPTVTFSTREYTVAGTSYMNSLGDLMEGIEVPKSNLLLNIKYFSLNMTLSAIAARINRINDAVWNGFPKGSLLVRDIQMVSTYDIVGQVSGADVYGEVREVTVSLEYQTPIKAGAEGWDVQFLNAGRFYKPASGPQAGKKIPVPTADGSAGDPRPLKSNGDLALVSADFHYLNYSFYDTLDFSTLLI